MESTKISRPTPATPYKTADDSLNARLSASIKALRQYDQFDDPSPASTYGETLVASSVPPTPFDIFDLGTKRTGPQITTPSSSKTPRTRNEYSEMKEFIRCLSTPTKTKSDRFIIKSADAVDDPFTTAVTTPTKILGTTSRISPAKVKLEDTTSTSPAAPHVADVAMRETAQDVYPADACIFVANLNTAASDADLAMGVENGFQKFGSCFAKIRRDCRGMPFAFLQFTDSRAADVAVVQGKNLLICGRKCRTERARVRRTLWVTRLDGSVINNHAVLESLRTFGTIERHFIPTPEDAMYYDIPYGGAFYQFARFKDCQEALANLRQNRSYIFELSNFPEIGMLERSYNRQYRGLPNKSFGLGSAALLRTGTAPPSQASYHERTSHGRTILVDNLPVETNYYDLVNIFGPYGRIMRINISLALPLVRRLTEHNTVEILSHLQATIEFEEAASASAAVREQHLQLVRGGRRVRVQLKTDNVGISTHAILNPVANAHMNTITLAPEAPLGYYPTPDHLYNMQPYPVQTPYGQQNMVHPPAQPNMALNLIV